MSDTLKPPAKCRPHDRSEILRDVASRCDRMVASIVAKTGWTQVQIAVRLGCSERALLSWCKGDSEPGTGRFEAIRLLHEEVTAGDCRRTG